MISLKRIIANNIYILRNQNKLTQEEFIKKLNINMTRGHLSHIENGENMASAEFIKAVSDAFGVSAEWLLNSNITKTPNLDLTQEDLLILTKLNLLPEDVKKSIHSLLDSILDTNYKK